MGAYYLFSERPEHYARTFVSHGVVVRVIASLLLLFPTGHGNALQVFAHQPIKGAAFEGLFRTKEGAGLGIVGQPNLETMTIHWSYRRRSVSSPTSTSELR